MEKIISKTLCRSECKNRCRRYLPYRPEALLLASGFLFLFTHLQSTPSLKALEWTFVKLSFAHDDMTNTGCV